jgi:hypothetical protein
MANRLDRNNPDVYFGRPGGLIRLPWPKGEIDKPYERPTFDFATGSGFHLVSSLTGGSRPYTINWTALHQVTYSKLEQFWTGMMGTGPWAFIDPSQSNMLLQNQAAATGVYNDARQWMTSTGAADMGELTSNATLGSLIHRTGARRSLRWRFPVAANAFPVLKMDYPYRNWWGFPVVPGLSYAWSAWARPDSVIDSSITMAIKLTWVDATGTLVSEISGGDVVMSAGYVRHSVVGVAPPGAVYCQPIFVATGSTITVGGSIYIDEPLLEQDTVVNDWAPGTGLRPVEILSLTDFTPFAGRFRKGVELVIRELAP